MPTKAGRSKFLGAMKIHNIKTITDDFREKLRPRPGDAFNGTAYRVLGDDGAVIPPLDRAMTADDILGRDSLYGIFELVHRGYMGLVQGPEMEINDGDAFRFEITGMEEFPCRPFQGIFMARPVSRPASRPESVAYAKAPPEVGAGTETATKPPIEEPDRIVCAGKYGLMGSETLEAYGNVRGMWEEHAIGDGRSCPVLRDDERTFNPKRGLKPGDVFSSILMNYRKGEGGRQGNFEIWQFQPYCIGYADYFNPGLYEMEPVPLGGLHPGWVYRFEVLRTTKRGRIFHCKAFKTLHGRDAVGVDFVNVKRAGLPRRRPFEFVPGQEYKVGIDHMDERDGSRFGVFYDALHPDKTGIVHFYSPAIAGEIRLGRWIYARVSHTEPGKKGRITVHSDFLRFA